jgi:isopropylmalate/homocitrate/citramalate synthase
VTFPVSASRAHSESNVRMAPDEMIAEVRKCAALGGATIEGAVSTAFGCTLQGEVPETEVVRIAAALAEFCDAVALADTVGYANPAQVKRLFSKVKDKIGDKLEGAHFHNTRGLGLEEAGVTLNEKGAVVVDAVRFLPQSRRTAPSPSRSTLALKPRPLSRRPSRRLARTPRR